jgi:lipoprotein-anchoring transpeptidase ErfK/SrfK
MKRSVATQAAFGAGAVTLAAFALAGCGAGAQRSEGSHQRPRAAGLGVERKLEVRVVHHCVAASLTPKQSQSYAVVVRSAASARTAPSGGAGVVRRFGRVDENGFPTVFSVLGSRARGCSVVWLHVALPTRPNGSTGWVPASEVRVYPVSSRIVVDLSSRSVSLYHWGSVVLSTRVAVGAPGTPTPIGRFYVDERFLLSSANGPFGVAALGISAHSNVLQDWVQGGPIALHGTNEPSSIGGAVSHGCVRLPNAAMARLFRLAPAGTPVVIHP